MPFTYSTLGQIQGTAAVGTYASVYQAASPTIVSSVIICNQAASSMTYRLAVASSTSPGTSEFIVFGATVPANDTVTLSLGITLSTGKYIVASSSANTSSFAAFGTVVS